MPVSDIAIDFAPFESALSSLNAGIVNLEPSTADVAPITCQAYVMMEYREKLTEVGALLEQYKALLEKDHAALMSVMRDMALADDALAGCYLN